MKEQYQTEELSRAIDALNSRKPYVARDGEIKQLINTATYVKQYGHSAKDTAIISQLSQRISADLAARRRRKRWLSGIAGVAAAALLFTNVSFQTQTDTAQIQPKQSVQAPQVAMAETATPAANDDTAVESSINQEKTNAPSITTVKESSRSEESTIKDHQPVVAKAPNRTSVLMVLPDRSADFILNKDGVIKQVYGQNTEKEIIVTQRSTLSVAKVETSAEPASEVQATAALKTKSATSLNKATRNVNGVEVVVEGKQPLAELEQVADSLVASAQPDTKQASSEDHEKKE